MDPRYRGIMYNLTTPEGMAYHLSYSVSQYQQLSRCFTEQLTLYTCSPQLRLKHIAEASMFISKSIQHSSDCTMKVIIKLSRQFATTSQPTL